MNILTIEKSKVVAQQKGWSRERAEGYVEGERYRRRGIKPSSYLRVGIDDYCRGFRAGYYERGEASIPAEETPRRRLVR